jgi:3,4-dihydroxy 2-butanone 4-phosphate synthase/GTP cyclohydrolase II
MTLCPIPEAIEAIRRGEMIILVDDEGRENEGDLVMAADAVTPEAVNFMARFGRGLICLSLDGEVVRRLKLPPMVQSSDDSHGTAFTVSIEAREGVTTGISAHDRAHTIRVAVRDDAGPDDLVRPGHIFPLEARSGGVLIRAGHTEGSVDLARLAGRKPAGVICEIMKDDGTMARLPDLLEFAAEHGLKVASIADLIRWRLSQEALVEHVAESRLPTRHGEGEFRLIGYRSILDRSEHVALVLGEPTPDEPTLVRVHSECLTGDVFGSLRCDCGNQLAEALRRIEAEGKGVLVYLRQEGRGIGLMNKIKAYALQDQGFDTVEANQKLGFPPDLRTYGLGAQMLKDIGVGKFRLLTNNPRKIVGLEGFGLEMVGREPLQVPANPRNAAYMAAKRERLGHLLDQELGDPHGH